MARPTSDVAICNLALDLVKEAPIKGFLSPTDKTAALCNRWYALIREAVLQAYNWNFALKSRAIQRGGTPEVSAYADYYVFPNDYLKLRAIGDPDIPLGERTFEIQGKHLFYDNGNEASLDIWYTKDETDVALYPALFIKLLSEELAVVLGKKLTARPAIIAEIKSERMESRQKAMAMNGQIRPPKRYENSRIVSAGLNPSSFRTVAGAYTFPEGMDD
jgi:hypothetical protein